MHTPCNLLYLDGYDKHWSESQGAYWYSFFNFLVLKEWASLEITGTS